MKLVKISVDSPGLSHFGGVYLTPALLGCGHSYPMAAASEARGRLASGLQWPFYPSLPTNEKLW